MKTAIIVHGMPSKEEYFDVNEKSPSNNHWFPWLQKELLRANILAQTPEMPTPYAPVYAEWAHTFEQFHLDSDTMLIGHSLGGGFLAKWLSEHDVKVGKVAFVAPWIDPNGQLESGFFKDLALDTKLVEKTDGVSVFISTDDDREELVTFETLKGKIAKLAVVEFSDKGHFIFEHMKTNTFPELRDYLLN